jgi:hypothetical protein
MTTRSWPLLVDGAHMLCELAERALDHDLAETGASIVARARELLERAALEAEIEIGIGPAGYRKLQGYFACVRETLARLKGLEVRLRALERFVEQTRRERARVAA